MRKSPIVLFVACVLAGAAARPAAAAGEAVTVAPPGDKTKYLSDKIKFQFANRVLRVDMTAANRVATAACAPAFTTFRGIGSLLVDSKEQPAFIVTAVPSPTADGKKDRCADASARLAVDDIVVIPYPEITSTPPDRYGLTYGTLLVPFKYHLRGDKDFTGGTSLGGYVGFRQDKSGLTGLAAQYVVFLGAASVAVPQTVGGNTVTQNMAGVSYGVGILGTVKDNFHLGVVLGADRVNASAGYKDNGKAWLAVSLGFAFSN
jgi:hypothetical protein